MLAEERDRSLDLEPDGRRHSPWKDLDGWGDGQVADRRPDSGMSCNMYTAKKSGS